MRRYFTIPLVLFVLLLLGGCAQSSSPSSADVHFEQLALQAWEYNRMQSPRYAAQRGDTSKLGQLKDESLAAKQERYQHQSQFYKQIAAIEPETLSHENQINRDMILYTLKNQLSDFEYKMYLMPLTNEYGPHSHLSYIASGVRIQSLDDANIYLQELSQIPQAMQQYIDYMTEGLATGYTQPAVVLKNMPQSVLAYITEDPKNSVFFRPVLQAQKNLSQTDFEQVSSQVTQTIQNTIEPAYMQYHDFLTQTYIPQTREDIAASNLPNGKDFYYNRALHYTTMDLSPEEIHQIGMKEVEKIRGEMETVIENLNFEGSFADFLHFLRTDPQFYVDTPEALLKEAAYLAKKADAALPKLFMYLPRTPYGIAPVPAEIAPTYTQGRYAGSSSSTEPGYYWVNTYALDKRPLYELEALTLHEAVPGHHLQVALAQELDHLPPYRQHTYISAFSEGWGLYSEYLGLDTGFYQDPYSDFGRLTYEMWRAARLVVDTGMHYLGWTRDQAVDFMASNTALSLLNVNTEIDRYISWPGQALSYKLGDMTIKALRAEAEAELGNAFDLREFHFHVLKNGSIPLSTLQEEVRAYIQATKTTL